MKKTIYLISWVFLGLIFSFIAHAVIEIRYLNQNPSTEWILGGACALPMWLFIGLPVVFGVVFFFIGRIAWHKIYEEHISKKHK